MNVTTIVGLLIIGLASGLLSSMVGIGGGTIIVPALVFLLAMSQKTAQGTSLAMLLPPIGVFAVMNYYKAGYVDFKIAGILCVSFILGSYFGSKLALNLDESILKRIFGVFLMIMAVKYLFFSK
ncbi:MAG: putative permease [Flavipsychrobacter sp.]|nr:putative permease [Flavipsychrobacter sp.]